MVTHFDALSARLRAAWKPVKQPTAARAFRCQCGRPVFFRNSLCLNCNTPLGYEPGRLQLLPLRAGPAEGQWLLWDDDSGTAFTRCANFDTPSGCNWLIHPEDKDAKGQPRRLCISCRLNRTIPDLTVPENPRRWAVLEWAKRRLVSQLLGLGLPVHSKVDDDPEHGLAFDFLAATEGGPPVMTGHASGLITLNVAEADDAERERTRALMKEPYRTLLGHFRHEVGHYYFERLVAHTGWLPHVRELFGDEQQDYAAALKRNYDEGPPADWKQTFISAYASCHPSEDWAETWAHYLHMVDTVDTALSFGIDADDVEVDAVPWGLDALWRPQAPGAEAFLGFLNAWTELTAVLNEVSRSMGQPDFYPFVLPRPAVAKLQVIHLIVSGVAPDLASAGQAAPPQPSAGKVDGAA